MMRLDTSLTIVNGLTVFFPDSTQGYRGNTKISGNVVMRDFFKYIRLESKQFMVSLFWIVFNARYKKFLVMIQTLHNIIVNDFFYLDVAINKLK